MGVRAEAALAAHLRERGVGAGVREGRRVYEVLGHLGVNVKMDVEDRGVDYSVVGGCDVAQAAAGVEPVNIALLR